MTVVCMETFGHWSTTVKGGERKWIIDGKDGSPYNGDGNGALTGTNVEILPNGGPTAQPISGRNRPAPGCVHFKGVQATGSGSVLAFNLATPITEYVIGFHLKVNDFDRAQNPPEGIFGLFDFHDRIIWTWGNTAQVGFTLDIEYLGANDEVDRYHINISQGNDDGSGQQFYDGKKEAGQVGEDPITGTFDYNALFRGRWYYIELYVDIDGSTGSWRLRVDGEIFGEELGTADTLVGSSTDLEEVWIASAVNYPSSSEAGSGLDYEITDFHVIDATGLGPDAMIFPAVIQKLNPTSESGTDIDFTPEDGSDNSAMIDEAQQDFDTTFNESNTATDKDRFLTSDQLTDGEFGDILAVQVSAVVKDELDTAARTMRCVIEEGGTEGVGTTQTLTETGYQTIQHIFDENPDTSAAWLQAEIEAAEFGYELVV